MSAKTIVSPAPAFGSDSTFSPCRSMTTKTRLQTTEKRQSRAAAQRAVRKLWKWSAMSSSVLKENSVPTRLRVRAMPKAMAISLPLNQRLMMALWTTMRDSDPAPKTRRPKMSIHLPLATATMTAPRKTRVLNSRLALRGPSLS